jgi:hypothetical protein
LVSVSIINENEINFLYDYPSIIVSLSQTIVYMWQPCSIFMSSIEIDNLWQKLGEQLESLKLDSSSSI